MSFYWVNGQARVVARLATHLLGNPGAGMAVNCYPMIANGNRRAAILPIAGRVVEGVRGGFDVYEIEYDHPEMHNASVAQGEPVLSGGVPALYDGRKCSELGAHYYPIIDSATAGTTGSLTALATYQWVAVFEWTDARGVRHQSAPSAIQEITLTSGQDSASLDVSSLQLTERQDAASSGWPVLLVLYRTKGNGSIFYREFATNTENDKTLAWQTFTSTAADSTLSTREILYTDGGVYANFQPPAFKHVVQHERRLWGISRDNPRQIWVSKILQPGYEMPGFPLQLVIQGEEVYTALASVGTQILAFTETAVYVYAGDPPNDVGDGGNLSGPNPVALHTGCINPKSIVQVSGGVVFQSRDSFWGIDGGLTATRIGGPVEDTVVSYPYCRAATLDQRREVVLFTMTDQENVYGNNPSEGVTLVWHYLSNEWSIWHYPSSGYGSSAKEPGRSSAMCWRGDLARYEYHQAQNDGTVIYHNNGWLDHDASKPKLLVSSPWLQFAGVAGFQRVRRVHLRGTWIGAHSAIVRAHYDFEDEDFAVYWSTEFDGTNDYVTMGNVAALDFDISDDFSIEAWVKTTDTSGSMIRKHGAAPDYAGWLFWVSSTGKIRFWLRSDVSGAAGTVYDVTSDTSINDGEWHLAAAVYQGGVASLYLDGALVSSTTSGTITNSIANTGDVRIGDLIEGAIARVSVWDSALTAAQIATTYNSGRPGDISALAPLSDWWMGDWWMDVYPTVPDHGSGGNDGTMTNMTAADVVFDVPSGNSLWCFTEGDISTIVGSGTEEHIVLHIPRQKCKAIRLWVVTVGGTFGTQVRWETLALEVAGKKGLFKLPSAARG